MYKIMVIEDDVSLRNQVIEILKMNDYEVYAINDFKKIIEEVEAVQPDLIVLDINLPYFDGNYYCRAIRKKYHMPIIVTSARDGESDQILSMELGSDDYIVKPFHINILMSHITACLRRSYGEYHQRKAEEVYGMTLEEDTMRLCYKEKKLELSKNECKLIRVFLQAPDKVVTREDLLETIWDDKEFVDDNTLTVNITRIKNKLGELGLNDIIRTKRGTGYIFCTEELR